MICEQLAQNQCMECPKQLEARNKCHKYLAFARTGCADPYLRTRIQFWRNVYSILGDDSAEFTHVQQYTLDK